MHCNCVLFFVLILAFDPSSDSCLCLCMLSCFSLVRGFETIQSAASQVLRCMGFSRQEYWSGLPCPPPGDLPDPGTKAVFLCLPHWQAGFFSHQIHLGSPLVSVDAIYFNCYKILFLQIPFYIAINLLLNTQTVFFSLLLQNMYRNKYTYRVMNIFICVYLLSLNLARLCKYWGIEFLACKICTI